ncbi:hypothetical protein VMUT_0154 [Vulcanisaeta moutnovskia 768-28]|uniref:Uncharacterized protein n=1 Tax=Vulcanisaeta moutnovskia (strain 768-28) TaxID=985053 RepID=F0QSU9_VULM7|nr:hypothetical protein [Vulcanisaeta moutnovskia]ADY00370.1 hypothetical protein VMUT_0154 [Vulcanisaeta moutnovskia 768-28]
MALGICWGVKVRGSARLRCGESVDDLRVVDEVNRLINEFISRVEKHKATLLSDSAAALLRSKYGNDVVLLTELALDIHEISIQRIR